jgi:hypothetical protein
MGCATQGLQEMTRIRRYGASSTKGDDDEPALARVGTVFGLVRSP